MFSQLLSPLTAMELTYFYHQCNHTLQGFSTDTEEIACFFASDITLTYVSKAHSVISFDISLSWMLQYIPNAKATLIRVMIWCKQALHWLMLIRFYYAMLHH